MKKQRSIARMINKIIDKICPWYVLPNSQNCHLFFYSNCPATTSKKRIFCVQLLHHKHSKLAVALIDFLRFKRLQTILKQSYLKTRKISNKFVYKDDNICIWIGIKNVPIIQSSRGAFAKTCLYFLSHS